VHFGAEGDTEWIFLRPNRDTGKLFITDASKGPCVQATEIEAAQFAEQVLEFVQFESQVRGKLGLGRRVAQSGGKFAMGRFDAPALTTKVARAPIQLAQAVENRAPNAEAGVGLELNVLGGIEFIDGIDQAKNASMNQIFELHVGRKASVYAARDIADPGEIRDEEALAFGNLARIQIGQLATQQNAIA
jgi:hypothetical protein